MDREYIQVTFNDIDAEQSAMLIAQLNEFAFQGFEETGTALHAFIPESDFDARVINRLAEGMRLRFTTCLIKETNWNTNWESNFQPVIIDDFAGIRANFHAPLKNVEHEILITPKMSFGTGHHATTEMMVRQMRTIDFSGKTVLDFGTGTGILAILAEKLGAAAVTAIDNDEWSIENARENVLNNDSGHITIRNADVPVQERFDIILANINKNTILEHFGQLAANLNNCGILLLSGIIKTDRPDILSAITQYNAKITGEISQGEWLCIKVEH
jgi:ribosomal protein L11 methyltransferase